MKRLFTVVGVFVLVVIASSLMIAQAQSDPRIGTWKINLAKSKYDPGPPPQSDTRTYEASGDGLKATVEEVTANGNRITATYTAKYDGKDYPYTGNPNVDTVALKRIDAQTTELTMKKGSKMVGTNRIVISKDGKMMTQTAKAINARGLLANNVVVYDKQ
jgi:hypothetical protein